MALTNNPNKSTKIEKSWYKEIDFRWAQLSLAIDKMSIDELFINVDDQEQFNIDNFLFSFSLLAEQILLGGNNGEWQNKFQTLAYERSAERTVEASKASLTSQQIATIVAVITGSLMLLPNNRNELIFLHKRANDSLTKWVTALITDVNTITQDSFNKVPKPEFIDRIKKRLDVTASRAKTIATTEVAQASQRAVTNQARIMSEVLGIELSVRWITVLDSKVRHLHATWHGKIFTPDQAEVNFNISPWNCRCGLLMVIEAEQSPITEERFAKERKLLLAAERR